MATTFNPLADVLSRLLSGRFSVEEIGALNAALRETFLTYASETEFNTDAIGRIEYGIYDKYPHRPPPKVVGFRLADKEIALVDLLHVQEDAAAPREVREEFPDLTDAEWSAVTRFVTVVFLSFEHALASLQPR